MTYIATAVSERGDMYVCKHELIHTYPTYVPKYLSTVYMYICRDEDPLRRLHTYTYSPHMHRKSIHLPISLYTYIHMYTYIHTLFVARSLTSYPLPRVLASQNAKRDRIAWRGRGAHAGCALAFPSTRARVLEGYTYTCGLDSPVGVGIGVPITK